MEKWALYLFIILLSAATTAQAQQVQIQGQVVDASSGNAVSFATISLLEIDTKKLITGTTTGDDGRFVLSTTATDYTIEVSFIGFEKRVVQAVKPENGIANLGVIKLGYDAQTLEEVVVRGEVSRTEFKLDKRVFNVGKDLSSTGASALEVLNNVPSVAVNIEGEISLRGSLGVQILVNGKPSVLAGDGSNALGTITADMIEKVEVITNPSAKYDAEGTAGIINIVIKKEDRKGVNGSLTVNTGNPDNHSLGLSLNKRSEKFNLFSQFGVGYRELPNDLESTNTDLITGEVLASTGKEFRNERFINLIVGIDYYINANSVVTLSGSYAFEDEDQPSETRYNSYDARNELISSWLRTEATEADNPKYRYELQFKNEIGGDEDHSILISTLGNFFGKEQSSEFVDQTIEGQLNDQLQLTRTDFSEAIYTFKADYSRPLSEVLNIEAGMQYVINDVSNEYEVQDEIDGLFVIDPDLTNLFEYNQKVYAAYGSAAYEQGKWGLKGGLRVETTDLHTVLRNTSEENDQNYTDLFPSVHTSYKISDRVSLQAGYSRRIFRPRLWDLNPFFNIRNNFNIRRGNPSLLPEYTDSYELTSIFIVGNTSLNFGVFHRYTDDVIERITSYEEGVSIREPQNVGTNRSTGVEFNSKYSPTNWLTLNLDFNYGFNQREGTYQETNLDFQANEWSTRLLSKMKLPWKIDMELTPSYRSSYKTVQGEVSDQFFMDLGLRKKLLKNRGVISLSIRDVFASRVGESYVFQEDYEVYSRRQRGRFIAIGFSYGFGKGEAMEFSHHKRF